jgi:hypothetical protein
MYSISLPSYPHLESEPVPKSPSASTTTAKRSAGGNLQASGTLYLARSFELLKLWYCGRRRPRSMVATMASQRIFPAQQVPDLHLHGMYTELLDQNHERRS